MNKLEKVEILVNVISSIIFTLFTIIMGIILALKLLGKV